MMILYRGINTEMFEQIKKENRIQPKSNSFEAILLYDGSARYDGSAQYGPSYNNAIIAHQSDSSKYKTSGISTTPYFEIAKKYALHDGKFKSGIILEFESDNLDTDEYLVINITDIVQFPKKPEDEERILKRKDNGPISLDIFTATYDC